MTSRVFARLCIDVLRAMSVAGVGVCAAAAALSFSAQVRGFLRVDAVVLIVFIL